MKKIILSTIACATIVLASNVPEFEFSPMVGISDTHDRLNLDNDKDAGLTLAIKDNYTFFDQTELAYFFTKDTGFKAGAGTSNTHRFLLSGVKNYSLSDKSALYALIGGGYEKISDEANGVTSGPALNWGGGFKYKVTDSIALKAEARQIFTDKDFRENNVLYNVGLAIPFGAEAKKMAPKTEEKMVKKPMAAKVMKKETNTIDMSKKVISHFDTDKAILKENDKAMLKKYAMYLKAFPTAKLVVEGHTDSTASETYNKSLAARRAMVTKAYIVDLGIDSSRVRTESYGETMPVVDNKTRAHRAMNRRTEVKVFR